MNCTAIKTKKLLIFDLDRTLTESKEPLDKDMADLIRKLLTRTPVVIITGGTLAQLENQFVNHLQAPKELMPQLYLAPTNGSRLYAWSLGWQQIYTHDIPEPERKRIIQVIHSMLFDPEFQNLTANDERIEHGELIEDRGSQITFSALGMQAPHHKKDAWDKDRKKRLWIRNYLRNKLPDFEVRTGGSSSVDVTLKGVDKGFAADRISEVLKIPKKNMLFIGDSLEAHGNDSPVPRHGVESIDVDDLTQTRAIIHNIITCYNSNEERSHETKN